MNDRNTKTPIPTPQSNSADSLKAIGRSVERARRDADECVKLTSLPIQHDHAAGIDAGDATHWACVDQTPDGGNPVREFPAHTAGLGQLVAWLTLCGVTTVALEASGAYGRVLFLTLIEAGFHVVTTAPSFTRQIKGRDHFVVPEPTDATVNGFNACTSTACCLPSSSPTKPPRPCATTCANAPISFA